MHEALSGGSKPPHSGQGFDLLLGLKGFQLKILRRGVVPRRLYVKEPEIVKPFMLLVAMLAIQVHVVVKLYATGNDQQLEYHEPQTCSWSIQLRTKSYEELEVRYLSYTSYFLIYLAYYLPFYVHQISISITALQHLHHSSSASTTSTHYFKTSFSSHLAILSRCGPPLSPP